MPFSLPQILNTILTFLTLKKEVYFIRVQAYQYQWNCEEPLEWPNFLAWPLHTIRESTTNKVSILGLYV